jgi:hypothetical protein
MDHSTHIPRSAECNRQKDNSGNFSANELITGNLTASGSINATGIVIGNNGAFATSTGSGLGAVMTDNLPITPAISGRALATGDGTTRGVQGISSTNQGDGVFGLSQGTQGAGVFGDATNGGFGVLGHSSGPSGNGVWGENFGTSILALLVLHTAAEMACSPSMTTAVTLCLPSIRAEGLPLFQRECRCGRQPIQGGWLLQD